MEIIDKDLSLFSDTEIVEMSLKLKELNSFSDRFGYVVAVTGFQYIGREVVREIAGVDYWWGLPYMSDEESRIAGNVFIKNRKENFIKEIANDISTRIKKCDNHLEAKNLIEAEINKIRTRINSGNLLYFKNGYESEARKSNTYFDKTSTVNDYEEATLGAAFYKIEQMLVTQALPEVNSKISENTPSKERDELMHELKGYNEKLLFIKHSGIWDGLKEQHKTTKGEPYYSKIARIIAYIIKEPSVDTIKGKLGFLENPYKSGTNNPYTSKSVFKAIKALEDAGITDEWLLDFSKQYYKKSKD